MAAPMYNVYVGSETGLLKGINVLKGYWDNLTPLEAADKQLSISSICWTDDQESELCVGLKNKCVLMHDLSNNKTSESFTLDGGTGNLKNVVKCEDNFITALETGLVHYWDGSEQRCEIQTDGPLSCMTQSQVSHNVVATGGKENDLKLWDVDNPAKPIFQAKNVKNDWLNLRVPVWVLGIGLVEDKIVTCTGHHQVRVYDPKSPQRRPVLDMEFDEYPITAMSICPTQANQVIVGNTQGKMGLLDLRKGKMVHLYKGFAGGIRSIYCHRTEPVVASCGLDRYVRVHNINSREMVHKVYVKSRLNCVVMSRRWLEDDDEEESGVRLGGDETTIGNTGDKSDDSGDGGEQDDIWDNLDVVQTQIIKRKETVAETDVKPQKQRKLCDESVENRHKKQRNIRVLSN